MNFEHLVEINDPENLMLEPLSREQLWRGLVLRAERPELTLVGLEACIILDRQTDYLHRELRFGSARIFDEVFLTPMQEVRYEVAATTDFPASQLIMRIEEPFPDRLFVRFIYSSTQDPEEEMVRDHLKQAYIDSDTDTVAAIREFAKMGKLGPYCTPNGQGLH